MQILEWTTQSGSEGTHALSENDHVKASPAFTSPANSIKPFTVLVCPCWNTVTCTKTAHIWSIASSASCQATSSCRFHLLFVWVDKKRIICLGDGLSFISFLPFIFQSGIKEDNTNIIDCTVATHTTYVLCRFYLQQWHPFRMWPKVIWFRACKKIQRFPWNLYT